MAVVRLSIFADGSRLAKTLAEAGRDLSTFGKRTDRLSKRLAKATNLSEREWKKFGRTVRQTTARMRLPMLAAGAAAVKLGADVADTSQRMSNALQAGTGASGEALEALKRQAKTVGRDVPDELVSVAEAMATVQTRFGFAGQELEGITRSFLNFGRVTGADVGKSVSDLSALMQQFALKGAKAADEAMGDLLRISQATGVNMDKFTEQLTEYGPVFSGFGFTLEETAALLGMLSEAGVKVSTAVPGLNQFLRKIAAAGGDPREALQKLVVQMEQASSAAEAIRLGTDAFGAEGAVRLAEAIQQGNFDLSDFNGLLADSAGHVDKTAESMLTLSDRLSIIKNRITIAVMPAIDAMVRSLEKALKALDEGGLGAAIKSVTDDMFGWADANTKAAAAMAAFGTAAVAMWAKAHPVIAGLTLAAGGVALGQSDSTRDKTLGALGTVAGAAFLGGKLGSVVPGVGTVAGAVGGGLIGLLATVAAQPDQSRDDKLAQLQRHRAELLAQHRKDPDLYPRDSKAFQRLEGGIAEIEREMNAEAAMARLQVLAQSGLSDRSAAAAGQLSGHQESALVGGRTVTVNVGGLKGISAELEKLRKGVQDVHLVKDSTKTEDVPQFSDSLGAFSDEIIRQVSRAGADPAGLRHPLGADVGRVNDIIRGLQQAESSINAVQDLADHQRELRELGASFHRDTITTLRDLEAPEINLDLTVNVDKQGVVTHTLDTRKPIGVQIKEYVEAGGDPTIIGPYVR